MYNTGSILFIGIARKHMGQRMREQIYNIVDSMQNALCVMEKLLKEQRSNEVALLLADCQECAIAIGSKLEKIYDEDLQTIHLLEIFCEQLYQMSLELESQSAFERRLELSNSLEDIHKYLKKEMKKEVVFLPYNASMWDSLESVWMAANEDENYNAYVVPIPYYDLDEKRAFKEYHYEGDLFPEYVPITHYTEYDLSLRCPDMIYIHNPYDNFNYVTSVDPEYYASNIKKYTDKLVYIPYFILDEIEPEEEEKIEEIKHFCFLPGTIYADKVIVQSENIRQIYINEYLKEAAKQGMTVTRKELEEKFLGLGSPKLDKVSSTEIDDIKIPTEWLRLIQKKDGTKKKVIFYNTSLTAFLKQSEEMLKKINHVLKTFKENQEEIVLLWRPHPLMEETISSMRPDLWKEYETIINTYRKEGWGIYDDSADLNRAITISDGYYGDGSSVVELYKKTGKPIMIQNVEILE